MIRTSIVATCASLSLVAVACQPSDDVVDELAGESAADDLTDDGKADGAPGGAYTYFALRADLRKCAFPACGGDFLSRLNRSTTVCHDGRTATEGCYTPELDWSESGLDADARARVRTHDLGVIVRGRFARNGTTKATAALGRFIITEAWLAETDAAASGVFVKVLDNGIRCIAAPCPSLTEKGLNTSRAVDIAEVDFTDAQLADAQLEAAIGAMFSPSGVIVAGDRFDFKLAGRKGKGRTATAVYQRVADVAAGACYVGGCSGQICSDQEGAISTCEFRPEYACYAEATCERQDNGKCGWTETPELSACLANPSF